tara:strand:- start:2280 stop:3212 length:933 start_codon:yes stop_codon:yes gene_type:complete
VKTSRKISKTFISFLVASFLIWLLITFSKEYTTVITYAVIYKNIPQNKLLQEAPINKIDITVKASGFKILRSNFRNKKIQLEASKLQRKEHFKFYFLTKNQVMKIQKQLLFGVELQEIAQDTIYLNLGLLTSKKVALKPNLDINYHVGYDLLNKIKISPDSIVISGPKAQVEKTNYLGLSKLKLEDVKSDFSEEVTILKSNNNFKISDLKTTISGSVDKFTEGKLQVPFTTKNLPKDINLTTLSEKVEIVFVVALSNFSKISEASFKVECDYLTSEKNNLGYLIPKVILAPDFIKSIKIIPKKIDFLIQK